MGNRDTHIGLRFMHRTFDYGADGLLAEGHGEEGHPGEPLKFKVYRNVPHYGLVQTPPLSLGDARWSFPEFRQQHTQAPLLDVLNVERLSALLYYTYGFSRQDKGPKVRWPFHRSVPSARCFFPVELYVCLSQTEHIPAGLYHYDNLHHRLAELRSGVFLHELKMALGTHLDGCVGVLLISALFWKNAFRYRSFSYRLCTQEAGLVVGNALLVAASLGLEGHVHYQFLDRPLHQLLGFEPYEESLLAAIPLYPYTSRRAIQVHEEIFSEESLLQTIEPITPDYIKTSTLDQEFCHALVELDQHSFLTTTGDFSKVPASEYTSCDAKDERLAPPPIESGCTELALALHRRSSGDMLFTPLPIPMSQTTFWEIIRYTLAAYNNDVWTIGPALQLFIVVNHVTGLKKGVYRFCHFCGELHVIDHRDITLELQRAYSQTSVNCASANVICYLVGDYLTASKYIGNRSYRILQMESGLAAQRLCTMSAAYGLTARCSDSYYAKLCKDFLRLADASPMLPLFQVIIGYERPGAFAGMRYRLPIL